MCPIIKTHVGYETKVGTVPIRTLDEKMFVGAKIEKSLFQELKEILNELQKLNKENPEKTFEELLQELEKKYNITIQIEDKVMPKSNIKGIVKKEPQFVYLLITAA